MRNIQDVCTAFIYKQWSNLRTKPTIGGIHEGMILQKIQYEFQKLGHRRLYFMETHVANKGQNGATHTVETQLVILLLLVG